MVVADGSPEYPAVVCALLDFHEIVDVIGRASTFDEAILMAVNLQPDLLLMDVALPFASLADASIVLSEAASHVRLIGMCGATPPPAG